MSDRSDNQIALRTAATSMRELHPISHPRHEMWARLADLMENLARGLDPDSRTPSDPSDLSQGLAVARSYLSSVDRPDLDGRA